jgi:transcriptional regulator with XRE-family HTH domain
MASNLKTLRLMRGFSIANLAVRSRSSPGTIIMVERYGHTPRHETRDKIAKALDVGMNEIWPCDDQPTTPTAA